MARSRCSADTAAHVPRAACLLQKMHPHSLTLFVVHDGTTPDLHVCSSARCLVQSYGSRMVESVAHFNTLTGCSCVQRVAARGCLRQPPTPFMSCLKACQSHCATSPCPNDLVKVVTSSVLLNSVYRTFSSVTISVLHLSCVEA